MNAARRVCFGIPSVFSFASKTCSSCDDFGACRKAAHDELKAAKDIPGARATLVAHARFEMGLSALVEEAPASPPSAKAATRSRGRQRALLPVTEEQQALAARLPKKVGSMVTRLFRRGLDVAAHAALNGEVANLDAIRGLRLVVEGALAGSLISEVRASMIEQYGWQYGAAYTECKSMVGALVAIGLIREEAGRIHRSAEKI